MQARLLKDAWCLKWREQMLDTLLAVCRMTTAGLKVPKIERLTHGPLIV